MGNTESAVVQRRLVRFRPDERPVIEGVFDRLQSTGCSSVPPGKAKVLPLDDFKVGIKDLQLFPVLYTDTDAQHLACMSDEC